MKSYVSCVFVIATLLASPIAVTFGEIVPDYDQDGEGASWGTTGSSYADGYAPDDNLWGNGYQSYYTTEAGAFTWSYTLFARGYAEIGLYTGDSCEADAWGFAAASVAGSQDSCGVDAYLSLVGQSGDNGTQYVDRDPPPEEDPTITDSDTSFFYASEGVWAAHSASAVTSAVAGRPSYAYAGLEICAYCNMH